jgi:hypothetical protein
VECGVVVGEDCRVGWGDGEEGRGFAGSDLGFW